jgi:hypothetical protein
LVQRPQGRVSSISVEGIGHHSLRFLAGQVFFSQAQTPRGVAFLRKRLGQGKELPYYRSIVRGVHAKGLFFIQSNPQYH